MLPWLSTWLFNPWLAVGTAAVASPILIHLLSRRRFRRIRWPAMEFLLAAHQKNRRRVRMEQLILLLLRCLAVFLLALMVARPFLRPGLAATLLGAAPRSERIIVLDDSFSMMYAGAGKPTFETAVAAVQRIARWIGSDLPGDALTLLLTSRPREPLVALPSLSESHLQELEDRLRGLAPSQRAAQPAEAMSAAADLVRAQPVRANTVVYVVSDFQRVDWAAQHEAAVASAPAASAPARPRSPIAALADAAGGRTDVRLVLIDVSAANPQNIAITGVRPLQRQVVAGVPARFAISVGNFSDADLTDVELSLSLADQALPPAMLPRVPARQTQDETVEVTFPRAGADFLRVSMSDAAARGAGGEGRALAGGLMIDNTRAWAGAILPAVETLLVDGEPNHDNYKDEVYLLRTALRPEGQAFSGNEVRVVEESDLDGLDLAPFHLVVLANVYRLSETARRALERFVSDGGGLAVYLGGEIDAGLFNETMVGDGRGLSPARLGEVITAPESAEDAGYGLAAWDEHHPIFRAFGGPVADLLRRVRFVRVFGAAPVESGQAPPLPAGRLAASAPASAPGDRPAGVLAWLNDADHTPLIIERPFGGGRVILITSTADLDWNTWPRDPSYVPFVLELASYLARGAPTAGWSLVGEPIRCTLDPNKYAPKVLLRLPGDRSNAPVALDARPAPDGGFAVAWNVTNEAGIYQFELQPSSGEKESRYVAVDLAPAESELAPCSQKELVDALPEMKFSYVRDLASLGGDSAEARRELWWPLLILAVVVLMTEHALAWWFGARR